MKNSYIAVWIANRAILSKGTRSMVFYFFTFKESSNWTEDLMNCLDPCFITPYPPRKKEIKTSPLLLPRVLVFPCSPNLFYSLPRMSSACLFDGMYLLQLWECHCTVWFGTLHNPLLIFLTLGIINPCHPLLIIFHHLRLSLSPWYPLYQAPLWPAQQSALATYPLLPWWWNLPQTRRKATEGAHFAEGNDSPNPFNTQAWFNSLIEHHGSESMPNPGKALLQPHSQWKDTGCC